MRIIGITGTLGAGKGTVVEYLVRRRGFAHFSVREYLLREMHKQGLPDNRDNMVVTANALRAEHSPSFIIEELYREAKAQDKDAVIESIRTPGEVAFLREQGHFILLAVDADPVLRYTRIRQRRSSTDDVDFETFLANEEREFTTTDPNRQNLKACIDEADLVLINNGSIEALYERLDEYLGTL